MEQVDFEIPERGINDLRKIEPMEVNLNNGVVSVVFM